MVINKVERQIPSVLADCYCLTAFSNCKTKKKLNQDLSLKLEPRQWPALDKNVRCRYDVGLRTLWRENKFLSTRFWWFLISFRTDIAYFFILTSHLTVFRHIRLSDLDGISLSTRLIIIKGVFLDIAFSFCPAFWQMSYIYEKWSSILNPI